MRYPSRQVFLAALLAFALVAGAGVVSGDTASAPVYSGAEASADSVAAGSNLQSATWTAPPLVSHPDAHESVSHPDAREMFAVEFEPTAETEILIHLDPDRDARWEVVARYEFTDANETAVFEAVGERFLAGEIGPSVTPFERFADGASRNAEREMRIEDVEREAVVHEDTSELDVADDVVAVGELQLAFTWTAFLEEDGENLVLGDALATSTGGTWLRSLDEGQSIEVRTPTGYTVSGTPGATVPLRDNAVIIDGPRVFEEDERVAIVYSPTGNLGTPPWTLLAGAIVLAAMLIAGGLLGYRRYGFDDGTTRGSDAAETGEAAVTAASGAAAGGRAAGTDEGDEREEDLSLLSDEERVERLVERNGGRMRQADIVVETGWSDAKVSQLLSAMAEEERVEKLRLGRENLISLPDETNEGTAGDGDGTARDGEEPRGGEESGDAGSEAA